MSDPDDIAALLADDPVPEKKRRGCLVSLLLLVFVFIPLFLLLLNGPGFRYLARLAGMKAAETRGLTGDFKIRGNLWSGFTLAGINFTGGDGGSTSLTVEEFAVGYRAIDLLRNASNLSWLDTVRIKKARLDLYLPEPGDKGENQGSKERSAARNPATEFSPLWNLLSSDIQIEDLTVFVHQGDTTFAIENLSLSTPAAGDGQLIVGKVALPGQPPLDKVAAVLSRKDHELSFGPLPLLNYASLEKLTVAEATPGAWTVDALVGAGGGMLTAAFKSPGEITLGLRSGSRISLDRLVLPLRDGAESKLRGSITDLDLRFTGDFTQPATWKINGKLIASGTGWGEHGVDTVVMLIKDNQLDFEAGRHRTRIRVMASIPFESAPAIHDLATLPIDLGLRVEVPSIGEIVADLPGKVPLTGAFTLEGRDIQIRGGKTIQSGSILLTSDDLAWDGIELSGAQMAANVASENQIKVAAELGLDAVNRLRLTGIFDVAKLGYEAETAAEIDTAGRLGAVLADLDMTGIAGAAKLDWKGTGTIRDKLHQGNLKISLSSLRVATGQAIDGEVTARYDGKSAVLDNFSLRAGGGAITGTGQWDGRVVSLPDWKLSRGDRVPISLQASVPFQPGTGAGFLDATGPLSLKLEMEDLGFEEITCFFAEKPPLTGKFQGDLTGRGSFDQLELKGHVEFRPDPKPGGTVTATEEPKAESILTVDLGLDGDLQKPSTWEASLNALVAGLHWNGMAIENISLKTATDTTRAERPLIAELRFDQSETTLNASARLDLAGADTLADLKSRPLKLDADLAVESFENLVRDFAPDNLKGLPLSGALTAKISDVTLKNGSFTSGKVAIDSGSFAVEDQPFDAFSIKADVHEVDRLTALLAIGLDEKNQVKADGGFHLKDQSYEGRISLNTDLKSEGSKLRKLLKGRAVADLLPSLAALTWEGRGNLREKDHSGDLALSAEGVTLAEGAESLDLKLAGTYTGTSADFPAFEISSRPIQLKGALLWENKVLKLLDWVGKSENREVLTLAGEIPLDRERLSASQWFSQDAPLALTAKLDSIPLETLSRLFRKEAPLRGVLSLNLNATGTPASPGIGADLLFDKISVPREKQSLAAGRLELDLKSSADTLALAGSYQHPDIKPLAIKASLPFHPGDWSKGVRKLADEPLTASANMESSSLSFLAGQIPGIESIAGEVLLNVEVKGSLAKPQLSGEGLLDVERLRLENRNAPSLHDIDLVARFAENRVVLEKLHAIVAGGIVEGSGEAVFKAGEEPFINLTLTGSEVLVIRNADFNVRTDLAVTLAGPWSRASLSGDLGITNSRFFKNFDLLPLGFPTRNTSVLPTVERAPGGGGPSMPDLNPGLEIAPFRDWGVDLRIHTKDPFLIRSNLVESAIVADLKVSGTLGRPVPNGYVAIDNGELSLPFSEVDVETGRVEFDAGTGFNGAIEFKAKGKADRYQISIYLFNRILSPQYVLTSIPPLPSEDIITLLATGTTRSDLVGEDAGSMAATKAATLFLKNLKKSSDHDGAEPSLLDLLEERTELELGRVNQETGEQTFGGKVRLWKQLFFVGDVDADSDYRALLKYVFSFR